MKRTNVKGWKVLTVVGARPQFVKAGIVSQHLRSSDDFTEIIVHTGQHFDSNMSEVFFDDLNIPKPTYNLGISSLSHGAMTGRMLEELEKIIMAEAPDIVMVYGDTNSTLAGALAAKKLHRRVAHVEAGLRSFDLMMPEEINRILTDRISDLLFCPTAIAIKNLENEGFERFPCLKIETGDVMFDAVLKFKDKINSANVRERIQLPSKFALCTIHRAENTINADKLATIFRALDKINQHIRVILPIHPRTLKLIKAYRIKTAVTLMAPVGYLEMLYMIDKCQLVLTDSGGLQKEAFFFEKCCLTLRDTTEWKELVENGVNLLVGSDQEKIVEGFHLFMSRTPDFSKPLYGDGNAGAKIVKGMREFLSHQSSKS